MHTPPYSDSRFALAGAIALTFALAASSGCSPKTQSTPSDDALRDSGSSLPPAATAPSTAPPSSSSAPPSSSASPSSSSSSSPASPSSATCDDDHPCAAGQLCRHASGAQTGACVKACGDGRDGRDTRAVGDTFPASDGCNTCTCADPGTSITCTEKACPCDPTRELNRNYKIKDPATCKAALFQCAPGTKPFFNTCGCGCEQPPSCPPSFNCMPGPGALPCDADAIKKKCPLSTIAY